MTDAHTDQKRVDAPRGFAAALPGALAGAALCAVLALMQGCAVGPAYVRPSVGTPALFKEAVPVTAPDGTVWTPANPQDAALRGEWWKVYKEPELDELEDRLNRSNQTIAQAYQNFMAARAQVSQARASYAPIATLQPAYTRSGSTLGASSGPLGGLRVTGNEYNFPLDVSWEPDLWGRIRNTVREYANAAQVSAADLANQKLSQQANLAQDYFQLRGQDELIALNEQTIQAYRQSLALTQVLGDTGIDDEQAIAQARLNLKTAEAAATNLGLARAQYEHAIALLIGVETAAFYPTVSISLSGGFQSSTLQNWFSWPSRFFSLGPSAAETLFDGGLRTATVAQYRAQYEGAVAAYRQSVLTAFQQTEDYLAAERILGQQLEQQKDVVAAAQRFYDLAAARYRTGVDTYLNVFVAQTTLLSDQQAMITLRVQQMTSSVQLIEALGGGWDTTLLPSESDVASSSKQDGLRNPAP